MNIQYKHSKKRDAILELLCSTGCHPTAQWVYSRLKPVIPDLSLGTVYRNLNHFKNQGLAQSVGVVDGEERFDGIAQPHPHLICEKCSRVIDLPETAAIDIAVDNMNICINTKKTVFYGLCENCTR